MNRIKAALAAAAITAGAITGFTLTTAPEEAPPAVEETEPLMAQSTDAISYPPRVKTDADKLAFCLKLVESLHRWGNARADQLHAAGGTRASRAFRYGEWAAKKALLCSELRKFREQVPEPGTDAKPEAPPAWYAEKVRLRGLPADDADVSLDVQSYLPVTARAADPGDPLEDFTTYTHQDPNNKVTVNTNSLVFEGSLGIQRNEEVYTYYDKGAGYFTDFGHYITVKFTYYNNYAVGGLWGVGNAVDDFKGWYDANTQAIQLYVYDQGATEILTLRETENRDSDTSIDVGYSTYYLYITKSGTAITVYMYTSAANRSAGTSLFDSLSATLTTDRSYRYVESAVSWNDTANTYQVKGRTYDLDLSIGVGGSFVPYPYPVCPSMQGGLQ